MKNKIILIAVSLSLAIASSSFAQTKGEVNTYKGPIVSVADKIGGKITKDELLKAKEIVVKANDAKVKIQVISYTMSFNGKGRDPIDAIGVGSAISNTMQEIIKKTLPGDKIFFEKINGKDATNGLVYSLPPISFMIE